MTNQTLCITCNAPPGQCGHQIGRYHDEPIRMKPLFHKGSQAGWQVVEDDRERWEAELIRATPPAQKPMQDARDIHILIVELENWIDLRPRLEQRVRDAYELDPLRVTRAVAAVVDGAEHHRLKNPAGVLVTRLNEIQARANGKPDKPVAATPDPWEPT